MTMTFLMVIWLMFALVGVICFGGATHQCAYLEDTSGYVGCGLAEGASLFAHATECRYAKTPLPVPAGVVRLEIG